MQEAVHITPLQEELVRLRAALAASGDMAYEWDLVSDRLSWFCGTEDSLGARLALQAGTGDAYRDLIRKEDRTNRREGLEQLGGLRTQYDAEYRIALPGLGETWVHDRACAEIGADGRPVRLTGVIRRIDANRMASRLRDSAINYDSLTGHFNRSRLREALEHALNYSRRYNVDGAYLVIGIDNLTMVNQALGHEAADAVLLAVGDRIDRCLRASDVIGRAGGDRFGVILSNVPESEIETAADKILEAVRHEPMETTEGPVSVTVSIGAVAFPGTVNSALDLMTRADVALQKAKHAGRDCAMTYRVSPQQVRHHRDRIAVVEQVQRALREHRLHFAYQPIVRSSTREVCLHECLLRMVQPDGVILPAGQFMPVVEELGMIRSIDRSVLERGVEELSLYPEARLAINVSGLTTTDRSWIRSAVAMLKGRPDFAERMVIEITETAGLEDLDACRRFVSTLRDLGCEVALDDFGAGYTSFRHLKQLAVNKVKIDGSFVRKLGENPDNLVFIRTLLDLARTFNLETVAECVENEAEARLLENEGIHFLQGYAFGYPDMMPPWRADEAAIDSRDITRQLTNPLREPVSG